jgi:hypothetical protein
MGAVTGSSRTKSASPKQAEQLLPSRTAEETPGSWKLKENVADTTGLLSRSVKYQVSLQLRASLCNVGSNVVSLGNSWKDPTSGRDVPSTFGGPAVSAFREPHAKGVATVTQPKFRDRLSRRGTFN